MFKTIDLDGLSAGQEDIQVIIESFDDAEFEGDTVFAIRGRYTCATERRWRSMKPRKEEHLVRAGEANGAVVVKQVIVTTTRTEIALSSASAIRHPSRNWMSTLYGPCSSRLIRVLVLLSGHVARASRQFGNSIHLQACRLCRPFPDVRQPCRVRASVATVPVVAHDLKRDPKPGELHACWRT